MLELIHMLQTIISILMALASSFNAPTDNIINYCTSCGEPWKIEYMVTCKDCGSWICPICNDSYIYTLGEDAEGCFTCNDLAPMGTLPEDYDYDQWN